MKKTLFLLTLFTFTITTYAETKNFIDQPFIEVAGSAKKEIAPDKIFLTITINDKENKAKKSVEALEKEMFTTLKNLNIDVSKNLVVLDLSSNFKASWYKGKDIVSTKQYELLIKSATEAGNAIVALEEIGISNIQLDRIDHSQIEKIKREVKIAAILDAKSKASDLLTAIGQKSGRALWILEIDRPSTMYRTHEPMMARANTMNNLTDAVNPEIEFQKIKIEYSIMAKFAID
ncbi:MAG: SIMPL domain-containing protein [Bacteroidales bacterium]